MKKWIIENKKFLIIGICLILSILLNIFSIKSCSNNADLNNNNIMALTDSIHYYKSKSGKLVASKLLLEGDINTLRLANDSLYNVVKDMKVKNPTSVVYINSMIDNGEKDTLWRIDTLLSKQNIKRNFAFNDEYRTLEGYVSSNDTTLGLKIEKDQVYFDYTIAVEDNKVFLKSNNPYIHFKEVTGITIPNKKKKYSIGIGPIIGYGYDFTNKHFNPYVGIGISLNYNLISW